MSTLAARTLIIGLDGGTWDLIHPFQEAGHLPNLSRLMQRGAWGPLRSTNPPMTFPAWSSFMTGCNPGKHGIFDFTVHEAGRYAVRYTNATWRRQPTIWQLLSDRGFRVGAMGFPTTYPPDPVNGFMISGFDAPVTTGIDPSFVHPRALYRELRREIGPYAITEFQEIDIGPGWHRAALEGLFSALERKMEYARYLLGRKGPWDCFGILFGESDTAAHHFWLFHDPCSPRHDPRTGIEFRDALLRVYQALDEAVGELIDRAGGVGTRVMILSDHGFGGAGLKTLHLNRWLLSEGLLAVEPRRGNGETLLNRLKRWGMKRVPPLLQEQLFRRFGGRIASRIESATRYGGIRWAGTRAYSDELNYFPSIWLNLQGREPQGTVAPGQDRERTLDLITDRLDGLRDPETGEPVVARAWRREELYHGPCVELAPDLVLELNLDRGYSYACQPTPAGAEGPVVGRIPREDRLGAKGRGMNGTHRRNGIMLLSGEGCAPGRVDDAGLEDLAPTLLHLLGQPVPAQMDGRVLTEALNSAWLREHPVKMGEGSPAGGGADTPQPYSPEEETVLRRRLEGLGYLEPDDD